MSDQSKEDFTANSSKQTPPVVIVKIARLIFVIGTIFSFIFLVYCVSRVFKIDEYTIYFGNKAIHHFDIIMIIVSLIFFTFFALGMKAKDNLKTDLAMMVLAVVISLYAIEIYLEFTSKPLDEIRLTKAKESGYNFDQRTKFDVVRDYRERGIDAYPYVPVYNLYAGNMLCQGADFKIKNNALLPLGGISNKTTILGNENGYWAYYTSDEHGFNNPEGLYKRDSVDVILLGDSYTEGYSVNSNESIAAILRSQGLRVISLGKCGTGYLVQLATLLEYALPLRPKVVLWLSHYENDIQDLQNEMSSPILTQYITRKSFSQNLYNRQNEIDSMLIKYTNCAYTKELEETKKSSFHFPSLINIITFQALKSIIGISRVPTIYYKDFVNIMAEGKKMISSWGGKLYFVYLPVNFTNDKIGVGYGDADAVLSTMNKLGIPLIDIKKEVFEIYADPRSLFPFKTQGHYNALGYKLVAEAIFKKLKHDVLF